MRSIKEIMAELGFQKDSPPEVQKAFIKHLITSAQQNEVGRNVNQPLIQGSSGLQSEHRADSKETKVIEQTQLEFDFGAKRDVS